MKHYPIKAVKALPRLPLKGSFDLTYRCNFNCRHCWLRIPPGAPEKREELSFDDIRVMVDKARSMGCREWALSGGEPMLRPDFPEIFDCLTHKAVTYSLNTNGSLITPKIAQLLRRQGAKMVALYGATAEVYDQVTRTPGSFEQTRRGIAYLQEAGAGFTVQLIPMRANYHQWGEMVSLAKSLSPQWRVGAAWLYLSSEGSPPRNAEIVAQRLDPREVVLLDPPNPGYDERVEDGGSCGLHREAGEDLDDRLFCHCIAARREFHLDPYGMMSWCSYIKDQALRYDLRRGSFREAWEEFIPSVADKVRGGREYRLNCGVCEQRAGCRWCAAYAYLETGRYNAPIPYLCAVAGEVKNYKLEWQNKHRRYFQIAGINVRVESDLDLSALEFKEEFIPFTVPGPGEDNVVIRHHFELPDLTGKNLGQVLYRKPPWEISRKNGMWFYRGIQPDDTDSELHRFVIADDPHTQITIYSPPRDAEYVRANGWYSLSLMPTDQIWLAPLLADRNAALFHAAAAILDGQGLLFVGHSGAGKSTMVKMLKDRAEILCDDRNIVRKWQGGWRVHGTWSRGEVADVSASSAPLAAILFLKQDTCNEIVPLTNRKPVWQALLATLIKPMVTAEWWRKELEVLERLVDEVSCYTIRFDKSGAIVAELEKLTQDREHGMKTTGPADNLQPAGEAHE